ncbi:MAG: PDGLE domain-containing protein, partial [Polyangiaceae bacterium]
TVHLAIGLGEGVITALVVATVLRMRPELFSESPPRGRWASGAALGLSASLGLAIFVSPFACSWPDGLERVVQHLGIAPARMLLLPPAPLRGYMLPGVAGSAMTTSLAAVAGTLLVFGLSCLIGRALAPRRARDEPPAPAVPSES